MEVTVFDTYVKNSKGQTMHFDILVKDGKDIKYAIESGKKYLQSIGEANAKLTTSECRKCHVERAQPDVEKEIKTKGYFIVKMTGCPS